MTLALITIALLFGTLIVGVPIAISFPLPIYLLAEDFGVSSDSLGGIPYEAIMSFPLVAIPLFLLSAEIMRKSGLAVLLTHICDLALKRVRAAFGYVMILASALFGSMTGSSLATVAAIGSIVGPEMATRGYPRGYCAALGASAGLLGVLLPPSIPLILYGSIVGTSIGQLFIATLAPALVMATAFILTHWLMSKRILPRGHEHTIAVDSNPSPAPAAEHAPATLFLRSLSLLLLPVVVLGGIYGGIFTPTEAAAVACVYSLALAILNRKGNSSLLKQCLYTTVVTAGAILIIIALTSIFNRAMVLNQVPQMLAEQLTHVISTKTGFLLSVNALLLVVGMFMETSSAILLISPLLMPAAAHYGVNPVHFGIIVVTNIEIGLLTPPLAANLFVAAKTSQTSLASTLRYLAPFLSMAFVVQGIITFVPGLSLWYGQS